MSSAVYTLLGIVVGVLVLLVLIFKAMWRVAEPNEALIISGLRDKGTVKDDSGDRPSSMRPQGRSRTSATSRSSTAQKA